jgi:hypothetical protein
MGRSVSGWPFHSFVSGSLEWDLIFVDRTRERICSDASGRSDSSFWSYLASISWIGLNILIWMLSYHLHIDGPSFKKSREKRYAFTCFLLDAIEETYSQDPSIQKKIPLHLQAPCVACNVVIEFPNIL